MTTRLPQIPSMNLFSVLNPEKFESGIVNISESGLEGKPIILHSWKHQEAKDGFAEQYIFEVTTVEGEEFRLGYSGMAVVNFFKATDKLIQQGYKFTLPMGIMFVKLSEKPNQWGKFSYGVRECPQALEAHNDPFANVPQSTQQKLLLDTDETSK